MCVCVRVVVVLRCVSVFVLTVQSCEAEHADLLCDVVPGPWCPQSLEFSFELSPHQQDSVSHGLHIVLPGVKNTIFMTVLSHAVFQVFCLLFFVLTIQ